jgi:phage baseplate assembly protein W
LAARSFKSVGERTSDRKFNRDIQSPPFGIKTPLRFGTGRSGIFDMNFDLGSQVHDNLKNLVLTNHGERLGHYDFGANLRELTTERLSHEDFDNEAMIRIRDTVKKYMPYINLDSFESSFKSPPDTDSVAQIFIRIIYSIPKIQVQNKGMEIILYCIG